MHYIKATIAKFVTILTFSMLFAGIGVANGQDITLSFPDELNGEPGKQFSLNIEVSDLTGLDVTNFDINFSFDQSLIELENSGIEEGELLSNQMQKNVTDDGRILLGYASATPIEGEGTLFTINGTYLDEGESSDGLTVTELFFGDGSLDVSPVVPFDIPVKVVPGQIALDFGGPISGKAGDAFTMEVEASDMTGLGVSNFDIEFSFDTSLLEIDSEGIEAGGLLSGSITTNVTDDGRILVSYASSQDLEGSGTLFSISGSLVGEGQNPEGLRVIDFLFGDGSLEVTPDVPVDISVDVEPVPESIEWELSTQNISLLSASESSVEFYIVQLEGDEDLQWSISTDADWLNVDGPSSGNGNATITLLASENETTEDREASVTVSTNAGNRTVSVTQPGAEEPGQLALDFGGAISGQAGDGFTMEVEASDMTDLGVSNFDVEFSYDTTLLEINSEEIEAGGLLSGSITSNVTNDGRILVSYASSQDLEGSGTLFKVSGTLAGEGENEQGFRVVDALIGDGSLDITPTFPADIAVDVKAAPDPIEWELSTQNIELVEASVSSLEFSIKQTGGTNDLEWSVSTKSEWLTVDEPSSGSGDATITLLASENETTEDREASVTVSTNAGDRTVLVAQPGAQEPGQLALNFGGPISGQAGDGFTIEVKADDLTGLEVSNFDVEFSYDTSLLEIDSDGVEGGGLLSGSITSNVTDDGRILVSYASSQDLEGSGTLFKMSGTLAGEGENEQGFRVVDALIGDGSLDITPTFPADIAVDVKAAPDPIEWELSTQNIELVEASVSSLEFSIKQTGGTDDLTWSVSTDAEWLTPESFESGTGDATLTYIAAANETTVSRVASILVSTNAGNRKVSVTQPGAKEPGQLALDFGGPISGQVGESITVEVEASDMTDLGVSNFDVEFSYDTSLLEIDSEGIEAGGLLSGSITTNVTDDGRILVSYASSQDLEGSGTLFSISGGLIGEGQNPEGLRVIDMLFGDGSLEVNPSVPVDIGVDVGPQPVDTLEVSPSELNFEATGGTQIFAVTSNLDSWTATADTEWITISGASGSGDDAEVSVTVTENTADVSRNGTIAVSGDTMNRTIQVRQEATKALGVVELEYPADGAEEVERDVTLRWQAEELASRYRVDVSTDASFNVIIFRDSSITNSFIELQGLELQTIYFWRVRAFNEGSGYVDWSETWSFGTIVTSIFDSERVPNFNLEQNYPNPFNPTTHIQYALPEQAHVILEVYNMLGQQVALLVNEMKTPGQHEINFDASGLSSGVYLYRLQTDSYVETRQMMLIK